MPKMRSRRKKANIFHEYCTGCGLCKGVGIMNLSIDNKGFYHPIIEFKHNEAIEFCEKICPSSGIQCDEMSADDIWGYKKNVYLGFSEDPFIRNNSSSGGIITSLCIYLIETRQVDGILQIGLAKDNPIGTKLYCSYTKDDIVSCSGSRYTVSSPLLDLPQFIDENKSYAFVGKPCDITALRNYARLDPIIKKSIKYYLSFFCAGVPSKIANLKLLEEMGTTVEECRSLKYRGDGWPGYATATLNNGKKMRMDYSTAWGKILGRDVQKACRFCLDGTGEMADLSCGDAWYLDHDKKPIFEENLGRNVVFARTEKGSNILNQACELGYIHCENYMELENMQYIQKYQFERKTTMFIKIIALKIFKKPYPLYNMKFLYGFSKFTDRKSKLRMFKGTCIRILKKRV